jgi:hypothetical protein
MDTPRVTARVTDMSTIAENVSLTPTLSQRAREVPTIRPTFGLISALVVVASLVAGWSVIYTTPWGTGTGWDQAMYIGAARNLLAGNGLNIAWSLDQGKPLTHFPPLYPSVLALLGLGGLDPWDTARYLNAMLRATDLLLVALLAVWAGGSRWAAAIAAFLMLTSVHMEFVHGSAWSDPLFLVLALGALAAGVRHLSTGGRLALIAAGALVACASLTRYAGLTLLPTLVLAFIWWRRPKSLPVFVAVAGLPLVAWVAHNALIGGALVGDRGIAWHTLSARQLGQALFTFVDWVLPSSVGARLVSPDGDVGAAGAVIFLIITALVGWWIWRQRRWLMAREVVPEADLLKRMLILFMGTYTAGIVISMAVFDDLVQLDARILAPVFACLVILVSAAAPRALGRVWQHARLRAPTAAAIAIVAAGLMLRFGALALTAHSRGVMYSNTDWIGSATLARVRELPIDATIFSNAPDAIYMLAGRSTYEIPYAGHAEAFAKVLRQSVQTAQGPVVLVYFGDPNIAYRQPVSVELIDDWLSTEMIANLQDGTLYRVEPPPARS